MEKVKDLLILDDNHNGYGFAKIDDKPIFIDKALKGDIVDVSITKKTNKYYLGKIISFKKKSPREEIKCPYYDKCGGCNLLHIPYEAELSKKKNYLEKIFKIKIKINSYDRFNYRNKVVLHVKNNTLGFYEEESNTLISIKKCILLEDSLNSVIKIFNKYDLTNIDEITIRSFNKKVLIKVIGKISNELLKELIKNNSIISIYQNNSLIYGNKYLEYSINNIKYLVNNNSFFQVNTICMENLYNKIKEYAGKGNSLLDLYCGSATIGIYLSNNFKNIIGVEKDKDSYRCALENIKINNISNYKIINGDSSIISDKFDVVIVDPPRSGLSKDVINNLFVMKPKKIIYVSCNPSTLKRDVYLLLDYKIDKMEAFNMFPLTKHVETVMILERKN